MARFFLIAALLLLLPIAPATAFDEPDGFRGIPWGATEETLRAKINVALCYAYDANKRWLGDRSCSGPFVLGDTTVRAIYTFRANRFVRVMLIFPSQNFGRLAAIFAERYGPPTASEREPFKTQGGLESTNLVHRWTGPTLGITLQRFAGKITEGYASFRTHEEIQESARLRREQMKGAAKDP